MKKLLCSLLLLTGMSAVSPAQEKVSDINFAHLYDPEEELFLHYRMVQNPGNGLLLVLEIELNNRSTQLSDYSIEFIPAADYNAPLSMRVSPSDSTFLGQRGQSFFLGYRFPNYPPLLIVKVTSSLSGLSFFQDVRTTDVHSFMLKDAMDRPVIRSYITEGRYDILGREPIEVTYYDHPFPPARPPMATDPGEVPRTIETTGTFRLDTAFAHIYDTHGLYHVSTGNAASAGESFRVQGPYYPEYVTIPDLVDPLIYITTTKERQKLRSAKDDKKQFDQFWVEMAGGKEKAKWIIKNYYDQVAYANELFTTYKEGWKTDRGMLFVVFGTPDQVIREQDAEIWTYLPGKRLPGMTFKLVVLQSRYADRQYSLLRSNELANGYIAAARYWREARPMDER